MDDEIVLRLLRLERDLERLQTMERSSGFVLFTVTAPGVGPVAGDTYSHNGHTYTVLVAYNTTLFCWGDGWPQTSGNLTRVTGAGSTPIAFSAVRT